ncbi:MAG: rhodanese-like domain-containing protein [Alphaproteobacteria bacterium]|nr:rhodanese-like domain-containing protein [Alphaproteobacteria bacterium]
MKNLSPAEVHNLLAAGKICLIDVREDGEYADERIAGAVLCPLSSFDPKHLPDAGSKPVVFHCAGGVRSVRAVDACLRAGLPHNAHMAGGLSAWKAAGLPTLR